MSFARLRENSGQLPSNDKIDCGSARLFKCAIDRIAARQREPASLMEITKKVITEHKMADEAASINITAVGDLHGTWDESRMCQALSNLIGNALKHGDRNEPVSVTLNGSDPDEVVWTVHNKGHIPESVLPYVFDPFRSFHSKATSGLGLGLYIVAQIVKSHGGTLRVESSTSCGTRFTVKQPRARRGASHQRRRRNP